MFYSEHDDDKNHTSSQDNDSDWEESSSEEDENSDSNTEELPLQDKNVVVSVSILERLICSSTVCKYCHESVSLIEDQQYSAGLARRFKIQCTSRNCQLLMLACRLIGRGYSAATKITSVLNLDRSVS